MNIVQACGICERKKKSMLKWTCYYIAAGSNYICFYIDLDLDRDLVLRHHLLHGLNFKNGWLQKKGGASMGISALQTWKTRWFHLRGLWLSYSKIDCISVYM